jgi:uncharacterized protein DUF4386
MAMLSGVLMAAYVVLDPTEEAATHRVAELSQAQLAFAYDVTSIGFSKVWLPMGVFALACGWVIVSTAALPRWLGWWGMISGIALALTQFVSNSSASFRSTEICSRDFDASSRNKSTLRRALRTQP